jgi:hypothetical protein
VAKKASTRPATVWLKIASPRATARIAPVSSSPSASLRTWPRAPARTEEHRVLVLDRGQDQDTHIGVRRHDRPGRLDAAHAGQLQVHEDDVRPHLGGARHGVLARDADFGDGEVGLGVEQRDDALPDQRVVLDDRSHRVPSPRGDRGRPSRGGPRSGR